MWYVLLIICLILSIIAFLLITKWTVILHICPKISTIDIKVICFTKKLSFGKGDSEKKNKKKKNRDKTHEADKNAEIQEKSHNGDKTDHDMGIFDKFQECKAKILAYKKMVFDALDCLNGKIEIKNIYLRFDIGTGDAAATGKCMGYIYAGTGVLYPILNRYFIMDFPTFDITPDFYQKRFDYEVKSIIRVRPVHIIKMFFVLAFDYLNMKKSKGSVTNE